MAARLIRARAFGQLPGTLLAAAMELGSGVALGLLTEKFVGQELAQSVTDGAFASVIRGGIKQVSPGSALITDALSDSAPKRRFRIKNGRVIPVSGYVGAGRVNGYVGAGRAVNGYVSSDQAAQIYGS